MNWYFYKLWLPLQLLTVASLILIFTSVVELNWILILVSWFLIGPIGIGIGYHKLFSHRQFRTYKIVEYTLAILGSLSAYAPLLFWASQHQYHHKVADTDKDPSSPKIYGFWESFLWWRFRESILKKIDLRNYCIKIILKDKFLMFISKHFLKIIWVYMLILIAIDINLFVNLFIVPITLEHLRINLISSAAHLNIPLSYKNFESTDNAYNNIIIGLLSFGFGWHNNHHNNPRELVNSHRWWEIDIEGIVAKLISKTK